MRTDAVARAADVMINDAESKVRYRMMADGFRILITGQPV